MYRAGQALKQGFSTKQTGYGKAREIMSCWHTGRCKAAYWGFFGVQEGTLNGSRGWEVSEAAGWGRHCGAGRSRGVCFSFQQRAEVVNREGAGEVCDSLQDSWSHS